MKLKTLDAFEFNNKKVLLRIDTNSPILKEKILDNPRFEESAKTINELIKKKAKIVIIAHQGRKGSKNFTSSLNQHALILSKYTNKKVRYINYLFEKEAILSITSLKAGEATLLKNVRCYNDEFIVKNSRFHEFSKKFDIFINDAFSVCHRSNSSVIIPPKHIPAGMGLSLKSELSALSGIKISEKSRKKSIFLIGGEKIEDYLGLFSLLKNKKNKIIASGVLANLILIARGEKLGYENIWAKKKGYSKFIPKLKKIYRKYHSQIILPVDFAIGNPHINKAKRKEFPLQKAPFADKIWDIGHNSVNIYKKHIKEARFIFMKGPLGYSENPEFAHATVEILKEISQQTKKGKIFSIIGGGHLTSTVEKYKMPNNFSHISLAGGALIAYLSGKKLPGLEALKQGTIHRHL